MVLHSFYAIETVQTYTTQPVSEWVLYIQTRVNLPKSLEFRNFPAFKHTKNHQNEKTNKSGYAFQKIK